VEEVVVLVVQVLVLVLVLAAVVVVLVVVVVESTLLNDLANNWQILICSSVESTKKNFRTE